MGVNLRGRSFKTLLDFTPAEIHYMLDLAAEFKRMKNNGEQHRYLQGKNIVLLFEKTSTRTRCAFEVAGRDLGMGVTYLDPGSSQMGKKESLEDTAKVLGRMFDGIEYRGYAQKTVDDLAQYSGVPVWNGLTDDFHPTQILADFLTMREKLGDLKGKNFCFLGDGRNNMANSFLVGCGKMGVNLAIIAPKELWPKEELVALAKTYADAAGSTITITDSVDAVRGADVIYTDVWASMGEEAKAAERVKLLKPFQVNKELMEKTGKESTIFMHCLPAVKGNEVTEEVFESAQSVVFDEAENRMHTIKAVMVATLGEI